MTETNAERLAHIQYQIDDARLHGGMYSSTHVELEWLIEQAERGQGQLDLLARASDDISHLRDRAEKAENENKRLREVLEEVKEFAMRNGMNDFVYVDMVTKALEVIE